MFYLSTKYFMMVFINIYIIVKIKIDGSIINLIKNARHT